MVAALRLAVAACVFALAGCSTVDPANDGGVSIVRTGLMADLSARQPRADGAQAQAVAAPVSSEATGSVAASFASEPQPAGGAPLRLVTERGEGEGRSGALYRLNFENADLRNVVQAVLGEALKINYVMGADVAGQVTISSPRAMNAEELLSALEALLQSNGFTMTKTGGTMRITAASPVGGAAEAADRTTPGYGLSVVPLRHVSASTMAQLVSGFVVDADGLKVDASRNAMIVRGSGPKRAEAVQAIMSFDADWMQDQAVGIYEVRRATPEAVVGELRRVFDAEEKGVGAGAVQFKAIGRLRAVMVIAKTQALMRRAETWVKRLDRESAAGGDNVFVYKARYRDARELARIMTSLFRAGGDGGGRAPATTGGRSSTGGSGDASDLMSDNRSGSSSSSSSSSGNGSVSNVSDRGSNAGSGSGQAGSSPFNSPFFGDGASAAAETGGSGGETIDLSRQSDDRGGGKVLISADPANNAVVTYADGFTYQKILTALRQLDSAPLQVAISATIAEVQLNDDMRNGVEYFVKSGGVGLGRNNGSFSLFGTAANALSKQTPGFNLLIGTNSNPDVVISALDRVTNVEVLSSPSLVVAENQVANFQVGDEIPIVTRQAQSVENIDSPLVNQVEFKNTGIILNVIPRIGQNDAVTMQIEQEISSVASGADTLTPTISKRRVASNISVVSGQTVLLAGLISKRNERGKNGLPILGDLKGIGNLFSQRTNAKDRTELVVFIRPVVIRSGEDAQSVAEEFRSRLTSMGGPRPATYTK
ncbi:type II secretion system secretin GspD [Methylopila sp. Yamaguchi]|uniref:type II secretion system secretin GspD n=1 Tax=Methylopila sp. Yamaguchi TaxID=1437817 RepID=UPI000CCC61E7|nr:type II secretion system secretin GspD [Methylopila sp. Yamaguchi]